MPARAALAGDVDAGTTASERLPQGLAHVDAPAAGMLLEATGDDLHDRQTQARDLAPGLLELGGTHLLEIPAFENLLRRPGHHRIELDLRRFVLRFLAITRCRSRCQSFGDPFAHLLALRLLLRLERRHEHVHHPLEQLGITPKDLKTLIEHLTLITAADQGGMQCPVEIFTAADTSGLDRPQSGEHPPGSDGQSGHAQCPREMHHIAGKSAGRRIR